MTTQQKIEKLKEFNNEKSFRDFLIDFLKLKGFTDVVHTHRYGSPEQGKDIIAKYHNPIDGDDWYSFVVKHGRIGGGTNEIETIKNQIKQSFEYPYQGVNGEKIKINKVKVVTNENFTGGAQTQISDSPELKIYNNFGFWWNEVLIQDIDKHYPDFWLPGNAFAKEYSKNFIKKLTEEIEIRELAVRRIDDKKIQRLLDIFIEPKLTQSFVEEDKVTHEKSLVRKRVNVGAITNITENIVISGDQGSGKSKILNTIACQIADVQSIAKNDVIPVRLKATAIRDAKFDIENLILEEVQGLSDGFYSDKIFCEYRVVLFVDDLDLLNSNDKNLLTECVQKYCIANNTYYVITYRKNEYNYDTNVKSIRIHNFNNRQIEAFVSKYFEGSDRGEQFIRVLKESDILSKLPTTPLTITLISLLYDENNFEIPATLSDIYEDFISVLLGKLEVKNKTNLLIYNIKKRLFTSLALKMLIEKSFEIDFKDFAEFINDFLSSRGYDKQDVNQLNDIIENSNLLFKDESEKVGFKQQAFVEFLASLEIYHHSREKYYIEMVNNFNDINWQNTAIFYAGHSKELEGMIDDVIAKAPNDTLKDWFVNASGMGYLSQALYQTRPSERKKLILKAQDNLIKSFYEIKKLSQDEESPFRDIPMHLIGAMINFWFNENFKSITLKNTLENTFEEIENSSEDTINPEFEENFKLLMIASTLMNPYLSDENKFIKLLTRKSFMKHPLLPILGEIALDVRRIDNKKIEKDMKDKIQNMLKKKREYIKVIVKEPAYRFNDNFAMEDKGDSSDEPTV